MRVRPRSVVLSVAMSGVLVVSAAQAQDAYIGEIRMVGFNFAPVGWAKCEGQLLSIALNTALFSLLGTTYGGDGITTFALPDLRGRFPIGPGQGPGLTNRSLGEQGGVENVTLNASEMPIHSHALVGTNTAASHARPLGRTLAKVDPLTTLVYVAVAPDAPMSPGSIGNSGGSQPHENMPPYTGITYIIALQGIFPSRP